MFAQVPTAGPPPAVAVSPPLPALRPLNPAAVATAPTEFAIFSSLGPPRDAVPPGPPAPAGSTLSRLKQVVISPDRPGLPEPRAPHDPPGRPGGNAIPAAAVTVPLGEVMRLIASGSPPAASPFDTFRAALRAPSSS